MRRVGSVGIAVALGLSVAGPSAVARAATEAERLAELERKVEVLGRELEKERGGDIFLPVGESRYGLGPAASKVYFKEEGISIGGYGEGLYQNFEGDRASQADLLRAVLYFGHKFSNRWVLNSEFEFEHASTSEKGSVSAEFVYLDYLWREEANFRVGLVLVPMGFINELHEPTTYLGARRPDIERQILPSTWRENGVGLFGDVGDISYKAYVVNGLRADGFTPGGIRDGRQKGSEALAEDLAGVVRVDWSGVPGLVLGASAYAGDSGQDLEVGVRTQIVEAHAEWRWRGLQIRALGVVAKLDDVAELNRAIFASGEDAGKANGEIDSIGEQMTGGYVELGYNVLNECGAGDFAVIPFVRLEQYDTQDKTPAGFGNAGKNDITVTTVGVNVKPRDEIVFKAEYMFYDDRAGVKPDQLNLAVGYVF